ncbi:hypothetical protein QA421_001309 [Cronobacter sakazakii]|uniref:hypothetical protein n=1 Tax=Enterobacteriaceae TaxID=543 RepID=UPI000CFDE002|nr:hypothetical protein [Cronobacter sakazakii]EJQ1333852.1 hypothetical protein [Cronobacter sakazakii]EJQ1502401.1 hypothetical protein [Cronobacter sakazakii]EJQ1511131.1 hypothetical protein [Cronobacter sakazakii]EJQ1522469.1 hypothetical protein [Cronobacter sakazakii]EJR1108184.1 hypothetical protein [Cronobacter sakazakii]
MTSKDKMARIEALESASVSTQDAWWREMCSRYGFPVTPIDNVTDELRRAVFEKYFEEFY